MDAWMSHGHNPCTHTHTHFTLQIEVLKQHNASAQRECKAKSATYEAEVQRLSSEVCIVEETTVHVYCLKVVVHV